MNYCVYLKKRKNKPFCKLINEEIAFSRCRECDNKEYHLPNSRKMATNCHQLKKLKIETVTNCHELKKCTKLPKNSANFQSNYCKKHSKSAKMKNKSNKLAKLERNRKSIFTDDLEHCYICGKSKDHLHELFFGRNRLVSIKFNFVIPVCSICHHRCHFDTDIISFYRKECQSYYEKNISSRDDFLAEFRKNYIIEKEEKDN